MAAVCAGLVLVSGLFAFRLARRSESKLSPGGARATVVAADGARAILHRLPPAPPQPPGSNRVVRVRRGQVLAEVNGRQLSLRDLFPLPASSTNTDQIFSRDTYEYLLKRAVDRELILQTAKAEQVELTDDQKRYLASVRAMRERREPGQVTRLTLNDAQVDFEMADAQAFLLQDNLLARTGSSPNVTPGQVAAYYQANIVQFGQLPLDSQARTQAWRTIDFNIRQQLAPAVRSSYQTQLLAYMDQLRAEANITVDPLPDSD